MAHAPAGTGRPDPARVGCSGARRRSRGDRPGPVGLLSGRGGPAAGHGGRAGGGGQTRDGRTPPDPGALLWGGGQTRIVDARKGDALYLVPAEGDPLPPAGTAVRGALE